MPSSKKEVVNGDRVIAISHSEGKVLYIFGYGKLEGYYLPPFIDLEDAHNSVQEGYRAAQAHIPDLPAVLTREQAHTMILLDHANPRIALDNGKTVWGYECWWDGIANFELEPKPEGFSIVEIDIDQRRAEAKAAEEALDAEEQGDDLGDDLPETLTPEMIVKAFKGEPN